MKVVILSCGEGSRLKKLGYKPMLPIGNTSIIGYIMERIKRTEPDEILFFTKPEYHDLIKIVSGYGVSLFYRETPSAFATLKEFAKVADKDDFYLILNSDVVFDEDHFERFVKLCRVLEYSGKTEAFLIWVAKMKGIGVSLAHEVFLATEKFHPIVSICSDSPYSFADVIFLPGRLCIESLQNKYQQIEKVIHYLRELINKNIEGYSFKGNALDIDTEADYRQAKILFENKIRGRD